LPADGLAAGDWLVSAAQARTWREQLVRAVAASDDGLSPAEAARELGLPDPDLLARLVADPVRRRAGRLVVDTGLPAPVREALDVLQADLGDAPFQAPGADRLEELGLDRVTLARLARAGELLVVGDGIALLPGSDDDAVKLLSTLPQPFTTSQARQTLETSRRVVLPLLAHLDRTGRTVRLPDDTRRVR
jgi:selenocysteine-specific elongation factor